MSRRRNYYGRRTNLMPTFIVLVVSLAAALGGAIYWDKLQDERAEEITYMEQTAVEEEISLPDPEADTQMVSAAAETPTDDAATEEEPTEKEESSEPESQNTSAVVAESAEADDSYFSDAAFVGDSLTQGLQLYDIIDTNVIANRGINLDTVYSADKIRVAEGYTSVLAELERIQPSKIYLHLGMNDIAWRDEKNFKKLYAELIDTVQEAHPDADLYIQSIFPVTDWYAQEEEHGIDNDKVVTYNQLLIELAEEKNCYYLDIHSALIDENGALPDDVSPDGIHLNAPYYKIWFEYVKTHVAA